MKRLIPIIAFLLFAMLGSTGEAGTDLRPTRTPRPTRTATPLPPTATTPPHTLPLCEAGTVWAETHSWWFEEGVDDVPRHAHTGGCMPVPGSAVNGTFDITVRYTAFAAPDAVVDRVRWRWDTGYTQTTFVNWACPGPGWDEQVLIGAEFECTRWVTFTIDPDKMAGPTDDLRVEQLLSHTDLGTASRVGLTSELGPDGEILRARGWYTGLDYLTVNWPNIGDYIPAGQSQPHLSGLVFLPVEFRNCDGTDQRAALFVDPTFHEVHGSGSTQHPEPIWQVGSCPKTGIWLDTGQLTPGQHLFYFQGTEIDARGEHSVALAIPVVVD